MRQGVLGGAEVVLTPCPWLWDPVETLSGVPWPPDQIGVAICGHPSAPSLPTARGCMPSLQRPTQAGPPERQRVEAAVGRPSSRRPMRSSQKARTLSLQTPP